MPSSDGTGNARTLATGAVEPGLVHGEPGPHAVLFHADDAVLPQQVAAFLVPALERGGVALLVATRAHTEAVMAALPVAWHPRVLRDDAEALRDQLVSGGDADRRVFQREVGARLAAATALAAGAPVHVYGEIVDLLWRAGDQANALRLESLWSEIAVDYTFSLLCGYTALQGHDAHSLRDMHAIASRHSHVDEDGKLVSASHLIAALEARTANLATALAQTAGAAGRLDGLLEASGELQRQVQRRDIADVVLHAGVATLGAANGAVWLRAADGSLVLEHAVGYGAEACARLRSIQVSASDPAHGGVIPDVASRGVPLFFDNFDEYARAYPSTAGAMRSMVSVWPVAIAALPLVVEGEVLGVIGLNFSGGRGFDNVDRTYLELLARHAAQAFERARLHEAEHAAREAAEAAAADVRVLYRFAEAVNGAESLEQIYDLAVDTMIEGVPVARAAILVFDAAEVMRFVAWRHLSDEYRAAVDGHSPWSARAVSPQPVVVDDVELDPAWASYLPAFRAEGIRALAFVPIVHHGRLLGKLMLYSATPRHFGTREIGIAISVASHVAHALDRRQAQDRERAARITAEDASRAREEILSVVSHDLRNPLSAILMAAGSLMRLDGEDARTQRTRTHAQRIQRNVDRMTRLIDDLVDFTAISTGRLALKRGDHEPEVIVRAAVDLFQTLADPRGVRLDGVVEGPLPLLSCDHDRVVQAIANLVANALKVTGPGGAISISARLNDLDIVFAVRDTGPGIQADELARVFERYWRSSAVSYKGTGLGLSIAKGIVEAHGGRIWAESVYGEGATFSFSIPGVVVD